MVWYCEELRDLWLLRIREGMEREWIGMGGNWVFIKVSMFGNASVAYPAQPYYEAGPPSSSFNIRSWECIATKSVLPTSLIKYAMRS